MRIVKILQSFRKIFTFHWGEKKKEKKENKKSVSSQDIRFEKINLTIYARYRLY